VGTLLVNLDILGVGAQNISEMCIILVFFLYYFDFFCFCACMVLKYPCKKHTRINMGLSYLFVVL
jgi:hypothetical protein